jgi:hypothetical protein
MIFQTISGPDGGDIGFGPMSPLQPMTNLVTPPPTQMAPLPKPSTSAPNGTVTKTSEPSQPPAIKLHLDPASLAPVIDTAPPPAEDSKKMWWILGGLGVVAVLGLGAVLLAKGKGGSKKRR